MKIRYLALFLACFSTLCLCANGVFAQGRMPSATGLWQQVDDVTGKTLGWFLIYENQQDIYEGAIAKMFIPPSENQNPVCSRCQGDQKDKPSLGLTIIKNMQRDGLKYENGTILDPRDGNIYNALMELSPDGQTLTVRGYLGIALFGRNQIWHRLPDSAFAQIDQAIIAEHAPALLPSGGAMAAPSGGQQRQIAPRGQTR